MGGAIMSKIIFKTDYEDVHVKADCLWDIVSEDIDGEEVLLRDLVEGKKCVLVVNVATQ
jgi:hypothetical protein